MAEGGEGRVLGYARVDREKTSRDARPEKRRERREEQQDREESEKAEEDRERRIPQALEEAAERFHERRRIARR